MGIVSMVTRANRFMRRSDQLLKSCSNPELFHGAFQFSQQHEMQGKWRINRHDPALALLAAADGCIRMLVVAICYHRSRNCQDLWPAKHYRISSPLLHVSASFEQSVQPAQINHVCVLSLCGPQHDLKG